MTTYTVTITRDGETITYPAFTAAQVKSLKANNRSAKIKTVKNEAPKFWYYRGTQVIIHEERQNGYTMVSSFDGTYNWSYANTAELEYR